MLALPVNPTAHSASPSAHLTTLRGSMQFWSSYGRWLLILLLAALSVLQVAPLAAQSSEPTFTVRRPFGTGNDVTNSVTIGDVNGDDYLDLVAGSLYGQSYVYLNDGQGNFPVQNRLPFGTDAESVMSVVVGDVNGDGYLDLVTGNDPEFVGAQSYVYLNDGQGNFPESTRRPFGLATDHTRSVAIGDLNGDGYLDLIAGNGSDPDITESMGHQSYIYLNDGQGNFPMADRRPFGPNNQNITSVALGDVDGDGRLDLVVGTWGAQNYVYLNEGEGDFSADFRHSFGTGVDNTYRLAVGDIDGDGHLDLITGNLGGQSAVYLNDGQGNFPPQDSRLFGTDAEATANVAVGDMDGDGYLDLVVGNQGEQNFIYLNDGQGNFPQEQRQPFGTGHDTTMTVAIGDLNNDGHLDIATGDLGASLTVGGQNMVYLNDGGGKFSIGRSFGSSNTDTNSVAVADLNSDGYLDLVVGHHLGQDYVYLNDGRGNFPQKLSRPFGTDNSATSSLAVGDLNNDGYLDLVVGHYLEQDYVYLNDGDGNFPQVLSHPFGTGSGATTSLAVGDLNNDGYLDLVVGDAGYYDTTDFHDGHNLVYLNDGQGNFPQTNSRPFGTGDAGTVAVALGDVDGDGDLDLIVGNAGAGMIKYLGQNYIYLNDGQGNFPQQTGRPFGPNNNATKSVAVGDMNGDGAVDIVVGTSLQQNTVYLNDGQGNFPQQNGRFFGTGGNDTYDLAVGDVDGDGVLDIVQGNYRGLGYIYLNDGQGNFPPGKGRFFGSSDIYCIAMGDVNGDGALDLIAGYGTQQSIYLNPLRQATGLVNHSLQIAITRPGPTSNANFYSMPALLSSPTIPITYTLFDQEGDQVKRVEASYSMDGGGKWLPAVAASGTVTQNIATGHTIVRGYILPMLSIPASTSSPLQARLQITQQMPLAEVEVWVSITGTQNSALSMALRSPQGTQVPLLAAGQAQGQNFQATRFSTQVTTSIPSGTAPYTGSYRPVGNLGEFTGATSQGEWTLIITNTGTTAGELSAWGVRLSTPPAKHTYYWDTFASGFFGQSDNVVVRLVAYSQSLSTTTPLAGTYRYTDTTPGPYQYPYVSATTFPFRVRGTQVRVVAEKNQPLAGALVYRLPAGQFSDATPLADAAGEPFRTDPQGYLSGRSALQLGDGLVALLPMTPTHPLTFTQQYSYFLTSAPPNINGLTLTELSQAGVVTLTVPTAPLTNTHPLMLFNLTVSLEWDASGDDLFQAELENGFKRASELLFKVTHGQAALNRVDVFPAKSFWNRADLILYANNSLRPSSAIGGVVKAPIGEIVRPAFDQPATKSIANAYLPGQIRMGVSWDPFGEETGDLSEQWWRALAHELSHHLFFLPDDYVGFKTDGATNQRFLGRVDCHGSFMTTTFDPSYTRFLDQPSWQGDCLQTLAAFTTGRSDWETITNFYPMLKLPASPSASGPPDGPNLLPLDITHLVFWSLPQHRPTLPARYFQFRNDKGEIVRLPTARVYLFQTQGNDDPTDDVLVDLGSPTGGGDRIKVRGGQPGDRLCLFDFGASDGKTYTGCIGKLSAADVSIPVRALYPVQTGARWAPAIDVRALTTRTLVVTVTQTLPISTRLNVQVFPAHYPSAPGLAPVAALTLTQGVYVGQVALPYPASDVSLRVWVDDGTKNSTNNRANNDTKLEAISQFSLQLPWHEGDPILAGPDRPMIGGPDRPMIGGPDRPMIGGPDRPMIGGPDRPMIGGPDYPVIGGAPQRDFAAPMVSADAQVVIYSQEGLFAPNGVQSLQILPSPPALNDETWLTPVGQAYLVEPVPGVTATRTIAVTYLQKDVPEGYEHTLTLYYLPPGSQQWQRLPTRRFVENLVVADLQPEAGVYAVMSTVALPTLQPGWNLLTYPLPDSRPITVALQSIAGAYSVVYAPEPNVAAMLTRLAPNRQTARGELLTAGVDLNIRAGPGVKYLAQSILRAGQTARVLRRDVTSNWQQIECPAVPKQAAACWVTGNPRYVTLALDTAQQQNATDLLSSVQSNVDHLNFGQVYWIKIEGNQSVTLFLAPPRRTPDGVIRGADK